MKVYVCDKCGAAVNVDFRITTGGRSASSFDIVMDLCENCYDSFFEWKNDKPRKLTVRQES